MRLSQHPYTPCPTRLEFPHHTLQPARNEELKTATIKNCKIEKLKGTILNFRKLTNEDAGRVPTNVIISEAFPLTTVGFNFINSTQWSVRCFVTPTPTGSKTQGWPFFFAAAADRRDACIHSCVKAVPIFMDNALDTLVKSLREIQAQSLELSIQFLTNSLGLLWGVDHCGRCSSGKKNICAEVHSYKILHTHNQRACRSQGNQKFFR